MVSYIDFPSILDDYLGRARRIGSPGAIFKLDLDQFREVVDTYGHGAGDSILRDMASVVQERLPSTALISRTGGDEITAILPDADRTVAYASTEHMRVALAGHPFAVQVIPNAGDISIVHITCSIGLALYPDDLPAHVGIADERSHIIELCNRLLADAKKAGGDRTRVPATWPIQ